MATRGAYGYRIDRLDKVTYNLSHSYPSCLGARIMEYVSHTDLDAMLNVAWHITLVRRESIPPSELISRYQKYSDLTISPHTLKDWHCLLFKARGALEPYHGELEHMVDSGGFLADSLLCEWAYIVNLDSKELEVYRGFNKDFYAKGRYSGRRVWESRGYRGVRLIAQLPFGMIKSSDVGELAAVMEVVGKL